MEIVHSGSLPKCRPNHGTVLQRLVQDIEPLKVLPGLLQHVVHDHERRIGTLEKRAST